MHNVKAVVNIQKDMQTAIELQQKIMAMAPAVKAALAAKSKVVEDVGRDRQASGVVLGEEATPNGSGDGTVAAVDAGDAVGGQLDGGNGGDGPSPSSPTRPDKKKKKKKKKKDIVTKSF
jgi:hypothetical protein